MDKCEDCKYFDGSDTIPKDKRDEGILYYGICRRNAPKTILGAHEDDDDSDTTAYWPYVEVELDWCGEFKPKEPEKQCADALRGELHLSNRINDRLEKEGIRTLRQLLEMDLRELRKVKGFGATSYRELTRKLTDWVSKNRAIINNQ